MPASRRRGESLRGLPGQKQSFWPCGLILLKVCKLFQLVVFMTLNVAPNVARGENYSITARMSVFAHQQQFLIADFDLFAAVGAEQHAIADLDLQLAATAVVQQLAVADADHRAAGRLILGRVRQNDAAGGARFRFFASMTTRSPNGCSLILEGSLLFFFLGRNCHGYLSSEV